MACAICETRRPRRFCPGVRGDICTICCGTEREVTVDCPLDCPYLEEAHKHEKPAPIDPADVPNGDVQGSEEFLVSNQDLCMFMGQALRRAALETPGAADADVREALEGLIRTYRTLQSGVYYESIPNNPLAGRIFRDTQEAVAEFRRLEPQRTGTTKTRDADVLGVLVFLQRVELDRNNGRKRGRSFIAALKEFHTASEGESALVPPSSTLILP
jgi:hypothetical protein